MSRLLLTAMVIAPLVACAPKPPLIPTAGPTSVETTASYQALRNLPAPSQPVPVAVYSYPDLTGQLKPSETVSNNSRAVTQGAVWMLVKALKDAGRRALVQGHPARQSRQSPEGARRSSARPAARSSQQTGQAQPGLPSLLFAGVILEGGIIGYDSNTITGGIGARYLGIGGDVQYRQDTVTVYLNAISSQTGEILKSVMTSKTVASYGVRGSVFKFVAFQKLLEGETGYTVNEPGQIAVAQAIEHAVRALIIEGALEGPLAVRGRDRRQGGDPVLPRRQGGGSAARRFRNRGRPGASDRRSAREDRQGQGGEARTPRGPGRTPKAAPARRSRGSGAGGESETRRPGGGVAEAAVSARARARSAAAGSRREALAYAREVGRSGQAPPGVRPRQDGLHRGRRRRDGRFAVPGASGACRRCACAPADRSRPRDTACAVRRISGRDAPSSPERRRAIRERRANVDG